MLFTSEEVLRFNKKWLTRQQIFFFLFIVSYIVVNKEWNIYNTYKQNQKIEKKMHYKNYTLIRVSFSNVRIILQNLPQYFSDSNDFCCFLMALKFHFYMTKMFNLWLYITNKLKNCLKSVIILFLEYLRLYMTFFINITDILGCR